MVVGDSSDYLFEPNYRAGAEFAAAGGLWMAVAACGLIVVFAALHCDGQLGRRLALHEATTQERVIALSAVLIAATAIMPWSEGYRSMQMGWSYNRVLCVLIAAIVLLFMTASAAAGETEDRRFRIVAAALSGICLTISYWFYIDVVGSPDPVVDNMLVQWLVMPRLQGAAGMYVALVASSAAFVAALRRPRAERLTLRTAVFDVSAHLR
jgi:hypothetical protein